jgi:integrase
MVQRRPRGHIRQRRNGKLQVLVYAGRDPVTGRQRYLAETVATRDEAERTLTRLLHQVDEQRNPNTRATVGHLLDRWLEVADLELSTRHGYRGLIERKIRPVLGDVPLRRLTVDLLDRFYVELRQHGHRCQRCSRLVREGKLPLRAGQRYRATPDVPERVHEPDCARGLPLAPSTVRQVHFILRAALNQAMRWGWIASNPATLASPPKFGHYEARPPSPEDVAKLLNAAWARDVDFGTLLWLAMTTGMRRGELCALRWLHVDLDAGELLIERSYVQRGKQHKEKGTKTHQARRIALDDATVELLTAHRERCEQLAALVGASLHPSGYVFGPEPGGRTPVLPDAVTQRFRRLAKRVGVPTSLHGFRHYSATQMLAAGVDLRTVAGRLGHGGGGATTLRVYASFVAAADRRAAEVLGQRHRPPSTDS